MCSTNQGLCPPPSYAKGRETVKNADIFQVSGVERSFVPGPHILLCPQNMD